MHGLGRVNPFRRRKHVGVLVRVGSLPRRRVMAHAVMFHVRILYRFHPCAFLNLLYMMVCPKHYLDHFYFRAKIKYYYKIIL